MARRRKAQPNGQKLDKQQEAAVALFQHRWKEAHAAMQPRFEYFRNMQRVYDGLDDFPQELKEKLEAETKIPWAYWNWETIAPRIADPAPRLEFKPAEPGKQKLADILKHIIRVQLEQGQFVLEQIQMLHDGGIFGFNVNQVLWHQKTDTFMVRQPLSEEQRASGKAVDPTFVPKEKVTENWALTRYKDPFDFFPDPKAISDQTWAYVFDRVWLSHADIKARQDEGVYLPGDCSGQSGAEDANEARPNETQEEAEARRQGKYPVVTMWGADGRKVVMCGDVLLFNGSNQYAHRKIPFVTWCTKPKRGTLFGESEMEKLQAMQQGVWISDTLRRGAYLRAQFSTIIADPGVTIPKKRGFGTVIRAIAGQRIEEWKLDANQGPSLTESENLVMAMQEMSGAAGVAGFNNPSDLNRMAATVGGIAQEEGNMRMLWKKLWFRLMIARAAKFMVQLDHQYLSELEVQRICGEAWTPIPPEEIPMFLDVLPEALSEQLSVLAERNSNIELLNIVGPLNGTQMHDGTVFTVKPVIEDTLKSYHRDAARYFHMPPQMGAVDPMTGMPITQLPMDPNTGLPIPQGPPPTPAGPMQPQQQQASAPPSPMDGVGSMAALGGHQ